MEHRAASAPVTITRVGIVGELDRRTVGLPAVAITRPDSHALTAVVARRYHRGLFSRCR
jgi:hypothetical protein